MRTVRYNRGDEIVEITIKDTSGARIEVRRCNISDAKENGKWLKWLMDKWGMRFEFGESFFDSQSEFFKF